MSFYALLGLGIVVVGVLIGIIIWRVHVSLEGKGENTRKMLAMYEKRDAIFVAELETIADMQNENSLTAYDALRRADKLKDTTVKEITA